MPLPLSRPKVGLIAETPQNEGGRMPEPPVDSPIEIGIMRAMGASRGLVISIYVLEGTLIGLVGAITGALAAWLVLLPMPPVNEVKSGGLPIDRQQGDFLLAIALTTLAATLASILPARRAARIDPVEAIGA